MMRSNPDGMSAEAERIRKIYRRRDATGSIDGADDYFRARRTDVLREMLIAVSAWPPRRVLEIGVGRGGWLADLADAGIPDSGMAGIDLVADRVAAARRRLGGADLSVGCGTELPFEAGRFDLVLFSTVFSSVALDDMRRALVVEARRVLAPGGHIACFDLRWPNPFNHDTSAITLGVLRGLFGNFVESRTLVAAPPLARRVSVEGAARLESVPWLRSHRLTLAARDG